MNDTAPELKVVWRKIEETLGRELTSFEITLSTLAIQLYDLETNPLYNLNK